MARFFYTPKPKQFGYKPRYYDPDQEARDKRREELLGVRPSDGEEYVPGDMLRTRQMRRKIATEEVSRRKKRSGRTIMLIAFLLMLAAALFWVVG